MCERGHAFVTLAVLDARKGQVVEVRGCGGLSVKDTAEAFGVSEDTVLCDWRLAKAWLKRELAPHRGRSLASRR